MFAPTTAAQSVTSPPSASPCRPSMRRVTFGRVTARLNSALVRFSPSSATATSASWPGPAGAPMVAIAMPRRHASFCRQPTDMADRLLAWYDRHARALPWRARAGKRADPYRVWLSEIMLQQTTVVAVGPYFRDFLARWPTVHDLATADLDAVLHAWQGLGYYARARNLHKCARVVSAEHGGRFPDSEEALRRLPGIGAYTAAAVAAIAFGHRATVMDANVERVVARLFHVTEPLPRAKRCNPGLAESLTPAADRKSVV